MTRLGQSCTQPITSGRKYQYAHQSGRVIPLYIYIYQYCLPSVTTHHDWFMHCFLNISELHIHRIDAKLSWVLQYKFLFASLQSVLLSYYVELSVLPVAQWQANADQLASVEQVTERLTFYNIMIKMLLSLRVI